MPKSAGRMIEISDDSENEENEEREARPHVASRKRYTFKSK